MNIQFGYKVVRIRANKLVSSHAFCSQRVQYSLRSWTKPKHGVLAVFQNYSDAKIFMDTNCWVQSCKISPCLYSPFRGKPPYHSRIQGKQFASKVKLTQWYGEE